MLIFSLTTNIFTRYFFSIIIAISSFVRQLCLRNTLSSRDQDGPVFNTDATEPSSRSIGDVG